MKFGGDVPVGDRKISKQLVEFEKEVDNDDSYPNEKRAQLYVCMAHDWYDLNMEEDGDRLLLKAEAICPNYFRDHITPQMIENEKFEILIKRITAHLLRLLTGTLRHRR